MPKSKDFENYTKVNITNYSRASVKALKYPVVHWKRVPRMEEKKEGVREVGVTCTLDAL